MDARRAPKRILAAHLPNQLANLFRHRWTPGLAVTNFPCPEQLDGVPFKIIRLGANRLGDLRIAGMYGAKRSHQLLDLALAEQSPLVGLDRSLLAPYVIGVQFA